MRSFTSSVGREVSSETSLIVIYPSRLCKRYAHAYASCSRYLSFHRYDRLLGGDFGVLLDGNLVVGLEGGDEVVRELGASHLVSVWAAMLDVVLAERDK